MYHQLRSYRARPGTAPTFNYVVLWKDDESWAELSSCADTFCKTCGANYGDKCSTEEGDKREPHEARIIHKARVDSFKLELGL